MAARALASSTCATLLGALLLTAPAAAVLSVYPSERDDGLPTAPASVNGFKIVNVYFDNGTVAPVGGACIPGGTSDEICQWAVRLETTGDLAIVDLAWGDASIVEDDEPTAPSQQRDGTGGNAVAGELGATRIGAVALRGTYGELRLYTPQSPAVPADFGFVDDDGVVLTVDPGGVLLATGGQMPWSDVSVGADRSCGTGGNGEIQCWGLPGGGTPPDDLAFREVVVGDDFGCALRFDDTIQCWGIPPTLPGTTYLHLGVGPDQLCGLTPTLGMQCAGAVTIDEEGPYRAVSRGAGYACGLAMDGDVDCFGTSYPEPIGNGPYIDIAGGPTHACGLLADGSPECWGSSAQGQTTPPGGGRYQEISAASTYTCGVRIDNQQVDCWGATPPLASFTGIAFTDVAAADYYLCGLRTDGQIQCTGTLPGSEQPPVITLPVVAAGDKHACEIDRNGKLACWTNQAAPGAPPAGADWNGLDSGKDFSCAVAMPTGGLACWGTDTSNKVSGRPATAVAQVTTGGDHACAINPDATVTCWGDDAFNQVSGTPSGSFLQLSAGYRHTCGVRPSGSVVCWGDDSFGQSADVTVGVHDSRFAEVSAGAYHTCARRATGAVACWGRNLETQSSALASDFQEVSIDSLHSCGLRSNGTAECWGLNTQGQATTPPALFASVDAGGTDTNPGFNCGVGTTGAVLCWGDSSFGQLDAVLDSDGDGLEDAIDSCPTAMNATQVDGDGDGVGDACDTCPNVSNANQFDRDQDGVGDLCDNCLDAANTDQADQDDDGEGDACEPIVICLSEGSGSACSAPPGGGSLMAEGYGSHPLAFSYSSASTATAQSEGFYELKALCPPSVVIREMQFAMLIPPSVPLSAVHFGGGDGCSSTSCADASFLGATAEPTRSYAIPGNMVPGGRSDAIYFRLIGKAATPGQDQTRQLCPGNQEVTLARVEMPVPPDNDPWIEPGVPAAVVSYTQSYGCPPGPMDGKPVKRADAGSGTCVPAGSEIRFDQYALEVGINNSPVRIEMSPALNDTSGKKWLINLDASQEVERVSIGFIPPQGTDIGGITFRGCPPNEHGVTRQPCNEVGGKLGTTVNLAASNTLGPDIDGSTLVSGTRGDVLYVTLKGNIAVGGGTSLITIPAGDPDGRARVTLGVVELGPSATPDVPPGITLDGTAQAAGFSAPFLKPGGIAFADSELLLSGTGARNEDSDADEWQDDTDNCPFKNNPKQEDDGGLGTTAKDLIGNLCQCGDNDRGTSATSPGGDGRILANDVEEVLKILTGEAEAASPSAELFAEQARRCSVSGNDGCDILDAAVLQLNVQHASGAPPLGGVCFNATPGALETD